MDGMEAATAPAVASRALRFGELSMHSHRFKFWLGVAYDSIREV